MRSLLPSRLAPLLIVTAGALASPLGAQEIIHFLQGDGLNFGRSVSGLQDVNGDLVDDLIVSQSSSSAAVSVLSGADGSTIYSSAFSGTPDCVSRAGDLDADGVEDFMAGYASWSSGLEYGRVAIWSGADGSTLYTLTGSRYRGEFGASIAPAGDVNADGHDDVLIGSPGYFHFVDNFVRVISGADGSILYEIFGSSSQSDRFGCAVAGLGDLDLDGHADFLIGASSALGNRRGTATVYSGRTGAVLHHLDGPLTGEDFGRTLCGTGDLDSDGVPDFAVSHINRFNDDAGLVTVYSGAQAAVLFTVGPPPDAAVTVSFGEALDASGDFDGDGLRDLLLGHYRSIENGYDSGQAVVCSGADGALLARFYGSGPDWLLGYAVAFAGDLNGDSLDEVLIGAITVGTPYADAGAALVFAGGAPPLLLVCPAIRRENGSDVRAQVSRATPLATVYLAGSPFGLGTTHLPQHQVTLALRRAQIGASTTADALGAASFTTRVPPRLYGRTVWLQAFEHARTSNWIERVVHQPWYW